MLDENFTQYISRIHSRAESANPDSDIKNWFMRPAISQLLTSSAYKKRDWHKLRSLAQDLIDLNAATIELARRYPDVFHRNVVVSRQCENRVHSQVVRRLTKLIEDTPNQASK